MTTSLMLMAKAIVGHEVPEARHHVVPEACLLQDQEEVNTCRETADAAPRQAADAATRSVSVGDLRVAPSGSRACGGLHQPHFKVTKCGGRIWESSQIPHHGNVLLTLLLWLRSRGPAEDRCLCPAARIACLWKAFRCTEPMVSDRQASSSAVGATSCKLRSRSRRARGPSRSSWKGRGEIAIS